MLFAFNDTLEWNKMDPGQVIVLALYRKEIWLCRWKFELDINNNEILVAITIEFLKILFNFFQHIYKFDFA